MAKSLGGKVSLSRVCLSAVSAFLAAATVSVAGMIGFVGLVVPHIARILVGSDYKAMLPTSVLLGAVVLLVADTIGRTIVPGMEIPVGIVMSVTGGPFFLYICLLYTSRQPGWRRFHGNVALRRNHQPAVRRG